jgi:U4/U6.U5 tri-snRNP-associated protein 1
LSIEETNKLRAKLGLKPLKMDEPKKSCPAGEEPESVEGGGVQMDGFVHKPAGNISKTKKEEELREKIRLRREKRQLESKLASKAPLLAAKDDDEDDDGDDSAAAWVRRQKEAEKAKRDAERRAKMLEEMDEEFGLAGLVEDAFDRDKQKLRRAKEYSAEQLKGTIPRGLWIVKEIFSRGKWWGDLIKYEWI